MAKPPLRSDGNTPSEAPYCPLNLRLVLNIVSNVVVGSPVKRSASGSNRLANQRLSR